MLCRYSHMAHPSGPTRVIYNGQPTDVGGWYVDSHGHELFMPQGSLAPICPHLGPGTAMWRLLRQVGDRR